jgi:hypothetical protein
MIWCFGLSLVFRQFDPKKKLLWASLTFPVQSFFRSKSPMSGGEGGKSANHAADANVLRSAQPTNLR